MSQAAEAHLARMADPASGRRLAEMGFDWTPLTGNVCAVVRFKRLAGDAPAVVGLAGGASSGKSTLFNTLLGQEVSRISAHAHETLGPVAAVPQAWAQRFDAWNAQRLIFPGLKTHRAPTGEATTGRVGALSVYPHDLDTLADVILLDLPDVTSKMAADEGATAHTLLPWFDALIIVVDEERWFDAAVFDQTAEFARNFGPRLWVVFNHTEQSDALTTDRCRNLDDHAASRHAAGSHLSPFQPGIGYRPMSDDTNRQLVSWLGDLAPTDRRPDLERYLRRCCAELVRTNVSRGEQSAELGQAVDRELVGLTAETSLTADLLTPQERVLLGLGRRFVPLYDALRGARRWLDRFTRRRTDQAEVDFEKRTDRLAQVLRRNLEHRVSHATDRINRIIADSPYLAGAEGDWTASWNLPPFDEHEWAVRIRAHIDAWKTESATQSRRGDVAALSVGMPLLLADLLFLGGAGLTFTWAVAAVAGLIGGKSMAGLLQRSSAFNEYQTTVRAYQSLIREALTTQWETNLAAMPRRHLAMAEPLLESLMYWATPGTR